MAATSLLALAACDRSAPPGPVAPATPGHRIDPASAKTEIHSRLRARVEEGYVDVQDVPGELRVVKRTSDELWACAVFTGRKNGSASGMRPPSPGGHVVGTAGPPSKQVSVVVVTTRVDGESSWGYSASTWPMQGTTPPAGECDRKLSQDLPDYEPSIFESLLP